VPRDRAFNVLAGGRDEADPLPDAKEHHLAMTSDLLHEPEPLNDDVVELRQLRFGQRLQHGQNSWQIHVARFAHPDNIPSRLQTVEGGKRAKRVQ